MTQTDEIIALLRRQGDRGLTPVEALEWVGSFRLAARISEARERIAHDEEIVTERAKTASGKSVARYVLRPRPARPVVQTAIWTETRQ